MISYRMNKGYSLRDYDYYHQIPILTGSISDSYPGHLNWVENKFWKKLYTQERGYVFAVNPSISVVVPNFHNPLQHLMARQLVGCSLLKNTPEEKKLSCLFVDPDYRGQGIASRLIKDSFNLLETEHPLMTVSEQNLPMLEKLIKKFDFRLTSVKDSVYLPGVKEYYYNEGLAR